MTPESVQLVAQLFVGHAAAILVTHLQQREEQVTPDLHRWRAIPGSQHKPLHPIVQLRGGSSNGPTGEARPVLVDRPLPKSKAPGVPSASGMI